MEVDLLRVVPAQMSQCVSTVQKSSIHQQCEVPIERVGAARTPTSQPAQLGGRPGFYLLAIEAPQPHKKKGLADLLDRRGLNHLPYIISHRLHKSQHFNRGPGPSRIPFYFRWSRVCGRTQRFDKIAGSDFGRTQRAAGRHGSLDLPRSIIDHDNSQK
jgi:hypothetical protein